MPPTDLATAEGLRTACQQVLASDEWRGAERDWITPLVTFLDSVRNATESRRATLEFQQQIWEESAIAATGQGAIPVESALKDEGFRRWLAKRSIEPLPDGREERVRSLETFYDEMQQRLGPFISKKVPKLKIFRVLAAFYPDMFTTIAHIRKLRQLVREMGGGARPSPIERHVWVRERLNEALGPTGTSTRELAARMALPWYLFARFVRTPEAERTEAEAAEPGEARLLPLPAARRRRGLTAIRGLFATVLSALEFIRDGVTREELIDFLRSNAPDVKDASLRTQINVLHSDLALIRRDGDRYVLSDRGEAVLESGEADDLADWLLTRTLGVDKAIVELRDRGPLSSADLARAIQSQNPGWSTLFVPHSILQWLRSMRVIDTNSENKLELTEDGRAWAARVHWTPEPLLAEDEVAVATVLPISAAGAEVELPAVEDIIAQVCQAGRFEPRRIAQLHAGLWGPTRRHFAILTGLSGSGKTLLAREYARAIAPGRSPRHTFILAVQPGWYDPSAVLGFVNPLRRDAYESTPFLQFLLDAVSDPGRPYVAILDEMNLSHPEQYLAPLFSAMETGDVIPLHTEDDFLDGIPRQIPYPANLALIGTVNMDETTHGISDKILDRAFTMEFWKVDLARHPRWETKSLATPDGATIRAVLSGLMDALAPARMHFGWRVVDDVLDFLQRAEGASADLPFAEALDSAVFAKILPKLRGEDSQRFREALTRCLQTLREHGLRQSVAKVEELQTDLVLTGSARFWR